MAILVQGVLASVPAFAADPSATPPPVLGKSKTKTNVKADCASCATRRKSAAEIETSIEEHSKLLGKNREYLLKLDSKSASKVIKIESNILMTLRAVEADRAKLDHLKAEMEKDGCAQCPTNEM